MSDLDFGTLGEVIDRITPFCKKKKYDPIKVLAMLYWIRFCQVRELADGKYSVYFGRKRKDDEITKN